MSTYELWVKGRSGKEFKSAHNDYLTTYEEMASFRDRRNREPSSIIRYHIKQVS